MSLNVYLWTVIALMVIVTVLGLLAEATEDDSDN